jgi:hypothetical protein
VPNVMDQALEAVQVLQDQDENELYRQLGRRVAQLEQEPQAAGYFHPPASFAEPMGISVDDLRDLGRRAFGNIGKMGYQVVCGGADATGGGHLQRLIASLGTNPTTITAAVATVLVTQIAIAPAVAGIIATLIVGKIAPTSLDGLCKIWQTKIA